MIHANVHERGHNQCLAVNFHVRDCCIYVGSVKTNLFGTLVLIIEAQIFLHSGLAF